MNHKNHKPYIMPFIIIMDDENNQTIFGPLEHGDGDKYGNGDGNGTSNAYGGELNYDRDTWGHYYVINDGID